jgi:hypothetical protein
VVPSADPLGDSGCHTGSLSRVYLHDTASVSNATDG